MDSRIAVIEKPNVMTIRFKHSNFTTMTNVICNAETIKGMQWYMVIDYNTGDSAH